MAEDARTPQQVIAAALERVGVADPWDEAQTVLNEFTDDEVAYFAEYRGYEVEQL